MVVCFARPEDWVPGLEAAHLAKITGILMLLALLLSFRDIRWYMPREVIFFCLLMIQLWLTVPFSPVWKGGAFNVMLDFSKVLPVVVVMYGAVRSVARLRGVLFVQAASVALIAIASVASRHVSVSRLEGALSGMYGNPNDLALVINLSLPLCLGFALTTRSYLKKLAWTVSILTMIYAVFLTASRGGAITLVIVALVCLWQLVVKRRLFYLLLLVPIAVIVIWFYGGNTLRERFGQSNIDPATKNNSIESSAAGSAQQREELLIQSLIITAQHPLFGVGPGNFEFSSGLWRVTHNSYTQMSAEGGIPAFLLYVLILWCGIANLREVSKYAKMGKSIRLFSMMLEASLAGYLVGSFFASVAYQVFPYCLIAYTSSLRLIAEKNRTVSSPEPQPHMVLTEVEGTV